MGSSLRFAHLATGMAAASLLIAAAAQAITIDGTKDAGYGAALGVQANATGFGDSSSGTVDVANGSEIDALYATVDSSTLYIIATGNLETNFNKLDFFIDNGTGTGQNVLGTLANNQGSFNNMTGLKFDAGFAPTRWIAATAGNTPTAIFVDTADLSTANTSTNGFYAGTTAPGSNGVLTGGNGVNPGDVPASLLLTLNNSNTAGVTGTAADPTAAQAVTTGVELAISLADLGVTGSSLKIAAFVNGSNSDFMSNQVIGTLPASSANPGNPKVVDFTTYAGDQFVTLSVPSSPEPASLGLLTISGLGLLGKRRRA